MYSKNLQDVINIFFPFNPGTYLIHLLVQSMIALFWITWYLTFSSSGRERVGAVGGGEANE